jgi:ribose transport system ATP-binding protein
METSILRAENISKHFAGIVALDRASLDLRRGEILAVVGANGAGKSTLVKIITGAHTCDSGEIYLEGEPVHIRSTLDARAKGISAVYQEFSLINTISVAENIYMGKLLKNNWGPIPRVDWKRIRAEAERILKVLNCDIGADTLVGDLSVSQRQMVEIAKAMSNDIKVLIMDEPTASLSEDEIKNLFTIIRSLNAKGISVIYISHRLEELPAIADRISIYRDGHYIITLPINEAPKPVIIEHMVGKTMAVTKQENHATQKVLLETRNFSSTKKFHNIDIKLHEGEILGIAGLDGAGRTEFVRALFGADPRTTGIVLVNGKEVRIQSPRDAKRAGIGFVTEDRKEEGLIFNMNIRFNIGMTILQKLQRFFTLDKKQEGIFADEYIRSLRIKCNGAAQMAKDLSGGNQQKVVLAKWLVTNPRILIMDEPTRGIDVGAKEQIYTIINELASRGIGIILISSELNELLQIANRIVVLSLGRVVTELENKELSQEILLDYATTKIEAS